MIQYTFNKNVDISKLIQQIILADLSKPLYITNENDITVISFEEELDPQQYEKLQHVVQAHKKNATEEMIANRIRNAMDFGKELIVEYATDNILANRSLDEIKHISSKLAHIQLLLLSGSLYAVLSELEKITPDHIITQEVIDKYIQKIKLFLNIK